MTTELLQQPNSIYLVLNFLLARGGHLCKCVHYISYRIADNFRGVINSLFPPPYENSLPERMHAVQGNKVILKITVFNLSMNAILGFLPHEYYPLSFLLPINKFCQ